MWSLCSPHSPEELPGHWTSGNKSLLEQQEHHQGLLGSIEQVSSGLGQTLSALLLGRSHFTFVSVITNRFGSFGQVLPNSFKRCPCSTAWALFWQPLAWSCLQTVLHLDSKAEEQKVASVLRRWKLSIHLFFTVTCSGPHFTKCLVSFIIVFERKVLLKLF